MKFTVSGKLMMGSETRPFSKTLECVSENMARNTAYALFGSKNGLPRNKIVIEKVEKA
jgi:ribosomal protein L20A (L18A)